jgi:hypothetical protein
MILPGEVIRKSAVQKSFVEHDQSIQTVLAYAADYALATRILPGRHRTLCPLLEVFAAVLPQGRPLQKTTGKLGN